MSTSQIPTEVADSSDPSRSIDAVDLLIYRGEKYKQNRLKLKQEVGEKEVKGCTFKPDTRKNNEPPKKKLKKNGLRDIKHRMNGALEKYIKPHEKSSVSSSQVKESVIPIQSYRASQDNGQQSTTVNHTESERHHMEEEKSSLSQHSTDKETSQRMATESSEARNLAKYLQSKVCATESSISNSGDVVSPQPFFSPQGNPCSDSDNL